MLILQKKKKKKIKPKFLKYNVPKYFDYNRLGKKYYNLVNNNFDVTLDKSYQYYTKKYNTALKFTIQPKKKNINYNKIKKFKFYVGQNFHSIYEKGKVDYLKDYTLNYNKYQKNTFYSKFLQSNRLFNKIIKLKKQKNKKTKKQDFFNFQNYFYLNHINQDQKFFFNFVTKKDYLNLIKFKKKFSKSLKQNIKFFKNLNNFLPLKIKKNQHFFSLNAITNTKTNFTNINTFDFKKKEKIIQNKIILNSTIPMNRNEFNYLVTFQKKNSFSKNFILKFYSKIFNFVIPFFLPITKESKLISFLIINHLYFSISNFATDLLFNKFNNLNLLNLNNLFFISKKVTNYNFLFFENKNFLTRIKQNFIRKIKNFNLKLLQKYYPDNIFDIPKKIEKPLIIKLIKNGNKNYNNNVAYLNFKKQSSNVFLVKKKNLFFKKNDLDFDFEKLFFNYFNRKAYSVRKIRDYFKSMDYVYLAKHTFFGANLYKKKKKRFYLKKKQARNLLSFFNFKPKKKQRRSRNFLEINLTKNVKIMKVDFS